ncbi:unnamed protein product, partial [Closterium sp. Naga37s-1]
NLRLYDAGANTLRGTFPRRGPVLDCCFHDDSSGFAGSADQSVVRYDFNVGREDVLGHHQGAVKCVEYSHATGQLITGGWDRTVRCWDPRAPSSHLRLTVTAEQPERCYSMSLAAHRLVVAMAGRHVSIYDLRNMSQPEQRRESSLKFQTRCVRCYPTGTGYALASVEGRVAMEFFDPSETAQAKKYAFKCHRRSEGGRDTVFPVNAIAFHPIYGTFATGGCDGVVNIWDGNNKKRLYQYAKYPTSIAALSFSRDGRLLAVAASYTFEMGDIPASPPLPSRVPPLFSRVPPLFSRVPPLFSRVPPLFSRVPPLFSRVPALPSREFPRCPLECPSAGRGLRDGRQPVSAALPFRVSP